MSRAWGDHRQRKIALCPHAGSFCLYRCFLSPVGHFLQPPPPPKLVVQQAVQWIVVFPLLLRRESLVYEVRKQGEVNLSFAVVQKTHGPDHVLARTAFGNCAQGGEDFLHASRRW